MDKCPSCNNKAIPGYKKYLTGPASLTSCEHCGAFITVTRDAYILIACYVILLLPVYLLSTYIIKIGNIDVALYAVYIGSFIYYFEKKVKWVVQNME